MEMEGFWAHTSGKGEVPMAHKIAEPARPRGRFLRSKLAAVLMGSALPALAQVADDQDGIPGGAAQRCVARADFEDYRAQKIALFESAAVQAESRGWLRRAQAVEAPPAVAAIIEAARAAGVRRYAKVRAVLIAQGASPLIVDMGIELAVAEGFDPILLLALSRQESNFNPKAKSKAGARGLLQIMPATAIDYGVTDPDALYDPATNYRVGIRHFKRLCGVFSGAGMCGESDFDPKHNGAVVTTASWNAGEGSVLKHKGVPPFEETRDFVEKVFEYYEKYKSAVDR